MNFEKLLCVRMVPSRLMQQTSGLKLWCCWQCVEGRDPCFGMPKLPLGRDSNPNNA